jgi:8-oxo-dGTP pyrophosphatase MutT (NUDIX family)
MKTYVLGFCFDQDLKNVVLIRKNRPTFQKDLLNGLGGELNEGEQMRDGMTREFREEAGVDTECSAWKHFGHFYGKGFRVCCFALRDQRSFDMAKTMTDEHIEKHFVVGVSGWDTVDNLDWLIPMAIDALRSNGMAMALEYL